MTEQTFETALAARTEQMLDACTLCGKCYEVCPIIDAAGAVEAEAAPRTVVAGVLDLVRHGEGPDVAKRWAKGCALSGDCIDACDYGVNMRFMLAMARVAMAKQTSPLADLRKRGVTNFRTMAEGANALPRLQLTAEELTRLGQRTKDRLGHGSTAKPGERPDFVFYTGCNVLKTPHIALLALDIMDEIGVTYQVMGGTTHCCGVIQLRTGDTEMSGNVGANTLDKLAEGKASVLSWCPSCHVQMTETTLPALEKVRGSRPFEMTPFMLFLAERMEVLRPKLQHAMPMRIALHRHPGVKGVVEATERLLNAVPGIEIVDLGQPAIGLMSHALGALPDYKRKLQREELEAAEAAGVDALVAVYHVDHRELCAHERDWPFRILNVLEIIGASMGLHEEDHFKRLKIMQDADAIVNDCKDLIAEHGLTPDVAHRAVANAMLAEQPLPLRGG
jgi:Fe-S oxidoreductase